MSKPYHLHPQVSGVYHPRDGEVSGEAGFGAVVIGVAGSDERESDGGDCAIDDAGSGCMMRNMLIRPG